MGKSAAIAIAVAAAGGPVGSAALGPVGSAALGPVGSAALGPVGSAALGPMGSAALGPMGSAVAQAVLPAAPAVRTCAAFVSYAEAVAYCMGRYGTTVVCGGRDRDGDGRPCECLPDAPDYDPDACPSQREDPAVEPDR